MMVPVKPTNETMHPLLKARFDAVPKTSAEHAEVRVRRLKLVSSSSQLDT